MDLLHACAVDIHAAIDDDTNHLNADQCKRNGKVAMRVMLNLDYCFCQCHQLATYANHAVRLSQEDEGRKSNRTNVSTLMKKIPLPLWLMWFFGTLALTFTAYQELQHKNYDAFIVTVVILGCLQVLTFTESPGCDECD